MMEFDNIKDFQIRNIQGKSILYKKGDVVRKNGRSYLAIRDTRGYSPEHGEKGGWKRINKNRIGKFSYDIDPPELPSQGDEWYDSDNGILFKYITNEDGNGQWVEM
jgi:hypothetical protein